MNDAQVWIAIAVLVLAFVGLFGWRLERTLAVRPDPAPPTSPPPAHGHDRRG